MRKKKKVASTIYGCLENLVDYVQTFSGVEKTMVMKYAAFTMAPEATMGILRCQFLHFPPQRAFLVSESANL